MPRWYDVVLRVWMVTNRQNNDGGCVWLTNEMKWIEIKLQIRNLNNWKQSKHKFVIFISFILVNIQHLFFAKNQCLLFNKWRFPGAPTKVEFNIFPWYFAYVVYVAVPKSMRVDIFVLFMFCFLRFTNSEKIQFY